jgi:hypothetical protein
VRTILDRFVVECSVRAHADAEITATLDPARLGIHFAIGSASTARGAPSTGFRCAPALFLRGATFPVVKKMG